MPARAGLARLWAPWRMAWIEPTAAKRRPGRAAAAAAKRRPGRAAAATAVMETGDTGVAEPPCLFCRVAASREDRKNLVLARRSQALLMLNRYPYNPAHLMVAVFRHKAQFQNLDATERADLLELTALAERALAAEYQPHGVNYGANVGRVAGAGFPGHLHLHLVPRWNGDTNFMPVVGETRVLPEALDDTWRRLRAAIGARGRSSGRARGARQK
jgi:ATP adenylyltransferase